MARSRTRPTACWTNPWAHNPVLVAKLKDRAARLAYAASALEHGWSRAVLVHHIEARTVEWPGTALSDFAERQLCRA